MSKLTWMITCMTGAELAYLEVPLRKEDRRIMELRGIIAWEIPDFGDMEGKVKFSIRNTNHCCWHFPRLVKCVEIMAHYVTDENDREIISHDLFAVVCPECLKIHGKIINSRTLVSRSSVLKQ